MIESRTDVCRASEKRKAGESSDIPFIREETRNLDGFNERASNIPTIGRTIRFVGG